jgi:hypothetical protein
LYAEDYWTSVLIFYLQPQGDSSRKASNSTFSIPKFSAQ